MQAAVDEALGPILSGGPTSPMPSDRVEDLLAFAYPRLDEYEATLRAALLQAMEQWSRRRAGTLGDEAPIVRGNRRELLTSALAPLRAGVAPAAFDRLRASLSLIFGTEAFVVLKDIWGLDGEDAREVALWSAHALVARRASADMGSDGQDKQEAQRIPEGGKIETPRNALPTAKQGSSLGRMQTTKRLD